MKIRNPMFLWVGVLMTLPLAYFVFDRVQFSWTSRTAMSTVTDVSATNGRCGSRKSRHDCTKFRAKLDYLVDGVTYQLRVSAGTERGHNQSLGYADHYVGQVVAVAYDPRQPRRAYRDTFWDIWGTPIVTFLLQVGAFFGSLTEPKQRRHDDD